GGPLSGEALRSRTDAHRAGGVRQRGSTGGLIEGKKAGGQLSPIRPAPALGETKSEPRLEHPGNERTLRLETQHVEEGARPSPLGRVLQGGPPPQGCRLPRRWTG